MDQSSSHIIIFNKNGEALIVKRSDNDEWGAGLWAIPGGHRENGETLIQNIQRETKEEVNLELFPKNIKFLKDLSRKLNHCFFTTNSFRGTVELTDNEHSEYMWIKPNKLEKDNSVPNLYEELVEAQKIMCGSMKIKIGGPVSEVKKAGMRQVTKGHDYYDITSDPQDGPRTSKGRRLAKRKIAKTQRRLAKKDITQQRDDVDEDKLPGGKGDNAKPDQFDKDQVARGMKVEMEHTNDPQIALEITLDHLSEDPVYYSKLATVEKD